MPDLYISDSSMTAWLRALAAVGLFALASTAHGLAPAAVFLDDLTWPELKQQIDSGKTTIIVPIGGTEQNGPHMALGKHNARARVLAEKIARELGNAIVAPVIAYVPEGNVDATTGHMRFPGTITVPEKTFEQVLEAAARSFRRHGFRDIVFIGDHSSYQKNEQAVADRLNREWAATAVRAHAILEYYRVTATTYVEALKSRGLTAAEIGTHAGAADTSLTMAVAPGMVRADKLATIAKPAGSDGVYGDPRRATAEAGQVGVDAIVAASVAAIRKATVRH